MDADYVVTMTYPADYYLLNVDTSPTFNDPSIVVKTANNAAAITDDGDVLRKPLVNGQLYFWRVQAFSQRL
ncbi:MAG: hypothetical protein IPK16_09160 [Anaerolineales bacterium]|nr:hypothetical protein [Anaerolineales bacterium]